MCTIRYFYKGGQSMKKILSLFIVLIFVFAGLGTVGIPVIKNEKNFFENDYHDFYEDRSACRYIRSSTLPGCSS